MWHKFTVKSDASDWWWARTTISCVFIWSVQNKQNESTNNSTNDSTNRMCRRIYVDAIESECKILYARILRICEKTNMWINVSTFDSACYSVSEYNMHTKFTKYTHEIGLINAIIIKYIALPIERMRYDLARGSKWWTQPNRMWKTTATLSITMKM